MKIHSKIPKLQQGGFTPPFVSWQPIPSTPVAPEDSDITASTTSSSSSSDEGMLSKEMIKLLMENGLPSDVAAFTQSLNQLYNDPVYRMTGQLNTGALSSQYLGMLSNLNKIKFNKEQYDNSIERLTSNGGLYDIAMSSTGGMIVQNLESGQLQQVSPEEYYKNYGQYKTVTNGDLAQLRATNPNLAFDNNIFNTLNNGIGQKEIQDYLDDVLTNLGSSTISSDGYVSRKGQQLIDGISQISNNPEVKRALIQAYTTEDGVYKISQSETSNVQQAEAALNYIYATLPQNMKNYILAKAASNGLDPSKGYKAILTNLIDSKINNTTSFKADYDSTLSKNAGLSKDSSSSKANLNEGHILLQGLTSQDNLTNVNINTGGLFKLETPAIRINSLHKLNQKDVWGADMMSKVINDSILSAGDRNNMYFGNKKVSDADLSRMMYNPRSGITAAYIPITSEGAPDLEALKNIELAEKKIEQDGIKGKAALEKQAYEDFGVGKYYGIRDREGAKKLTLNGDAKIFFMVDANTTNDDVFKNPYSGTVNEEEYDSIARVMNEKYNAAVTKGEELDVTDGLLWLKKDIYSGTFYIAAPDEYTAQFFLGDIKIPATEIDATNMLQEDLQNNIRTGIISRE